MAVELVVRQREALTKCPVCERQAADACALGSFDVPS